MSIDLTASDRPTDTGSGSHVDGAAAEPGARPVRPRERVFAAADALTATGDPVTVATVRDRAGCSNALATEHLRAWRTERAAAEAAAHQVPDLPGPVARLVERGITALWLEAVNGARAMHDDDLSRARTDVEVARDDSAQLARDLDATRSLLAAAQIEAQVSVAHSATLEARLADEAAALRTAESTAARRAASGDELKVSLAARRDEVAELRRLLAVADEARAAATRDQARADEQVEAERRATADLRDRLDQARAETAEARRECAVAHADATAARTDAARLDGEVTALRDALREAREHAVEAERDRAVQAAARAQAEGEVAGLRSAAATRGEVT